jgi:hypothetical protein
MVWLSKMTAAPSLFFSYSHRDEEYRDELEMHLAPLTREGLISTWHDRRITAGNDFAGTISVELERADIILLLVGSYFLSSDYCHDIEMRRAMERHEAGEARVVPIILRPCDWHSAPFGKLLALPKDGKPVSKHSDVHDAFLDIAMAIRQSATELSSRKNPPTKSAPTTTPRGQTPAIARSSNLRVLAQFSDYDKAQFRHETFEYIANYFENSLNELTVRNGHIKSNYRRVDGNTFTASIFADGTNKSSCRVAIGSRLGDFTYSFGENSAPNSCNEWMSIEHDGHLPFLRPARMQYSTLSNSALTREGAAEYFWSMFIEPLQRK